MTADGGSNARTEPGRSIEAYDDAVEFALNRVEANLELFDEDVPSADTGPDLQYDHWPAEDWTPSFWTGLCWLGYDLTGESSFADVATGHLDAFEQRIEGDLDVDESKYDRFHVQGREVHDLGFVYSLSAVAQYRHTGEERPRQVALRAADFLADRFLDDVGIVQAFGDPTDPADDNYGETIIDCLMNLPLLFWAADETGYDHYADIATRHALNAARRAVRDDGSTVQHYGREPATNGEADPEANSYCWSRGQAWAVYGFALAYRYTGDQRFRDACKQVSAYYLDNAPDDLVPRVHMTRPDDHRRDTSAAAVAACGLLELASHCPAADSNRAAYVETALATLDALDENFRAEKEGSTALLTESSYSEDDPTTQSDNATIFGDYFYLEGLARATTDWTPYW